MANLLLAGPRAVKPCFLGCSPTAALGLANVGVLGSALRAELGSARSWGALGGVANYFCIPLQPQTIDLKLLSRHLASHSSVAGLAAWAVPLLSREVCSRKEIALLAQL